MTVDVRGKEKYDYIPSMIDSTVRNKNFTHATLCTGRHAFNKYLKSFETLELKICTTRKPNIYLQPSTASRQHQGFRTLSTHTKRPLSSQFDQQRTHNQGNSPRPKRSLRRTYKRLTTEWKKSEFLLRRQGTPTSWGKYFCIGAPDMSCGLSLLNRRSASLTSISAERFCLPFRRSNSSLVGAIAKAQDNPPHRLEAWDDQIQWVFLRIQTVQMREQCLQGILERNIVLKGYEIVVWDLKGLGFHPE
ncbi:hypothetical protein AFLA_011278 [Aspergillus flavus NRRL3357]|nr:hypothetical protein AFLA_011278 [Aspergillus flavus NRRL3357]